MRTFMAVARREFLERRSALAAAAMASVIPFLVPLVRGLNGNAATEARQFTAMILGATIAAALSLLAGAAALGGDLAARRSSFYFSRPISSLALWTGKFAGGIAAVVAALTLFLLPVLFVDRGPGPIREIFAEGLGHRFPAVLSILSAVLLLLLVGNTVGLIVRSRSALALLDLALFAGASLLAWTFSQELMDASAAPPEMARLCGLFFAALACVALAMAAHRATSRGRTDIRAAHRANSATLWTIVAAGMLAFGAWSRAAVTMPAASLKTLDFVDPMASDGWVDVVGQGRGVVRRFLLDTKTGRSYPTSTGYASAALGTITVSEDGRVGAWLKSSGRSTSAPLVTVRLDQPDAVPVETNASFPRRTSIALSSDGSRAVAFTGGLLSVFELPSGHSLGSVAGAGADLLSGYFVGNTVRRLLERPVGPSPADVRLEIQEFDAAARKLTTTGIIPGLERPFVQVSPSGDRLLVRESNTRRVGLYDGHTGSLVRMLREGVPWKSMTATFLSNGDCALGTFDGKRSTVEVFSSSGDPRATVRLPTSGFVRMGYEPSAGSILATVSSLRSEPRPVTPVLYQIDLVDGTVKALAERLWPNVGNLGWPHPRLVPPGSEATKLFWSNATLVRFDPASGERRVLLGHP